MRFAMKYPVIGPRIRSARSVWMTPSIQVGVRGDDVRRCRGPQHRVEDHAGDADRRPRRRAWRGRCAMWCSRLSPVIHA